MFSTRTDEYFEKRAAPFAATKGMLGTTCTKLSVADDGGDFGGDGEYAGENKSPTVRPSLSLALSSVTCLTLRKQEGACMWYRSFP